MFTTHQRFSEAPKIFKYTAIGRTILSRKDFYSLCVAENKKQVQCESTEARDQMQHSTLGWDLEGWALSLGVTNPPHG